MRTDVELLDDTGVDLHADIQDALDVLRAEGDPKYHEYNQRHIDARGNPDIARMTELLLDLWDDLSQYVYDEDSPEADALANDSARPKPGGVT